MTPCSLDQEEIRQRRRSLVASLVVNRVSLAIALADVDLEAAPDARGDTDVVRNGLRQRLRERKVEL